MGAVLDTLEAAVGVRRMLQACFVAGTPLRGEFGARPIESFRVGDRIWSRDENDPQGADGLQVFEEVFVRLGRVLWLTVNGQRIGTTSEHPFYSPVHGWCNAGDLSVGASVLLRDGSYGVIEAMEAGEYATVYNLRVSDWHTYFVGEDGWGFDVWCYNACIVYDASTKNYRDTKTGQFVNARNLPWPSGGGFSTSRVGTVRRGTVIDRFGSPSGFVACRPGDTASQRGLPPGSERRPHTRYEAVKTIKGATIGTAAPVPSFDATGGGRQYTFGGRSIQDLVNAGHLREIS